MTCRSTLQTPSGPSIDELVAAQQNNVKRLAALISQAATGHTLELSVSLITFHASAAQR